MLFAQALVVVIVSLIHHSYPASAGDVPAAASSLDVRVASGEAGGIGVEIGADPAGNAAY